MKLIYTQMDAQNQLRSLGFALAGAIRPGDSGKTCHADITDELVGCVVYALVVGDKIVRFGTAGRGTATLKMRMQSTASALNSVLRLAHGRSLSDASWHHRRLDPFKQHAPTVIAARQAIEVWAKASSPGACAAEERELDLTFAPAWKNQTDTADPTTLSIRLTPGEQQLIKDAAAKKGWKPAHFLRVSALERAAHVLNLSRPSSFDFTGLAKKLAEVLTAPRTVTIADIVHQNAFEYWVDLGESTSLADLADKEKFDLDELVLEDFKPKPLTPQQVEDLQTAIRLGGAEFAAQVMVECRRLAGGEPGPNLPPPIDPQNLEA